MSAIIIGHKRYDFTAEPANVMSPDFTELTTVATVDNDRGLLYQSAKDQRLAFAPGRIPGTGPMAFYLHRS